MQPRLLINLAVPLLLLSGYPASVSGQVGNATVTAEVLNVTGGAEFDEIIKGNRYVMVMFYAPWCGWSQRTLPAMDTAAANLTSHEPPVKFIKVDCEADGNPDVCDRYALPGYPSLRLFIKGKTPATFDGYHPADEIIEFITNTTAADQAGETLETNGEVDDVNLRRMTPRGQRFHLRRADNVAAPF